MNAIEALVQGFKGATFVGIDTETEVKLKGGKKNPMQGHVTKRSTATVQIFTRGGAAGGYENKVNRRLNAEGQEVDFEVGPRSWGVRRDDAPIVDHNGEQYLEVIYEKPGKSEYLLDGQPIQAAEIIGLDEGPTAAGEQGGLENKVIIRTFKFSSIKGIRIGGKEYKLD